MKRNKIITTGKDSRKYEFEYEIHSRYDSHDDLEKIEIRLFGKNDSADNWFDFKLAPIDETTLKVTDMFIGVEEHREKGIPEALILESKKIFNKQIISSSNKHKLIYEWRKEPATKVWKRLVNKGLANYDEDRDLFYLK